MVHANEESAHADRLAERIVQLGGEPASTLRCWSAVTPTTTTPATLKAMVKANLIAERVAESYRQMIQLLADKDPTTRRLIEQILADEGEHADELADMLDE